MEHRPQQRERDQAAGKACKGAKAAAGEPGRGEEHRRENQRRLEVRIVEHVLVGQDLRKHSEPDRAHSRGDGAVAEPAQEEVEDRHHYDRRQEVDRVEEERPRARRQLQR